MIKYIEELVNQCNSRFHLRFLFPIEPFFLHVDCENRLYGVSISNTGCRILTEFNDNDPDFILRGDSEEVRNVFNGQARLSQLIDEGKIEVTGGYRPLLFVESVLWLTRSEEEEIEI